MDRFDVAASFCLQDSQSPRHDDRDADRVSSMSCSSGTSVLSSEMEKLVSWRTVDVTWELAMAGSASIMENHLWCEIGIDMKKKWTRLRCKIQAWQPI